MFELLDQKNTLRKGVIHTLHGDLHSPFFMPVATKGSIRGIAPHEMLSEVQSQILLMNTYHLYLKPGYETVRRLGGLHSFTTWPKPILTDSGGYQVFSLSKIRKLTEEGAEFRSHIDGSKHMLTPEESIRTQYYLGSDIIMVLDECPPGGSSREYIKTSLELTTRWARRCREELDRLCKMDNRGEGERPLLFGIVQGGIYEDLRKESLTQLQEIGFDGYAIGGVSVGESRADVLKVIQWIAPLLPEDKPRYLMGLGKPEEIVYAASLGVDMFDCVIPTREARHGTVYVWKSADKEADVHRYLDALKETSPQAQLPTEPFFDIVRIQNGKHEYDMTPIDPYAGWEGHDRYGKAYIRHLFQVKEHVALECMSRHNLAFYLEMMRHIRSYNS